LCHSVTQTVANFYLAFEQDLVLLPVLNKVDLPSADPAAATEQMVATFDINPAGVFGGVQGCRF
jgi:translation elongation factor EF-4